MAYENATMTYLADIYEDFSDSVMSINDNIEAYEGAGDGVNSSDLMHIETKLAELRAELAETEAKMKQIETEAERRGYSGVSLELIAGAVDGAYGKAALKRGDKIAVVQRSKVWRGIFLRQNEHGVMVLNGDSDFLFIPYYNILHIKKSFGDAAVSDTPETEEVEF